MASTGFGDFLEPQVSNFTGRTNSSQYDMLGTFNPLVVPQRIPLLSHGGLLDEIVSAAQLFGVEIYPAFVDQMPFDGIRADTFKLLDVHSASWCLQRCKDWRITKDPSVMPAVHEVTQCLTQAGITVPEYATTPDGRFSIPDGKGHSWLLSPWIESDSHLTCTNPSQELPALGALLGRMHRALDAFVAIHGATALHRRESELPDFTKWYGRIPSQEDFKKLLLLPVAERDQSALRFRILGAEDSIETAHRKMSALFDQGAELFPSGIVHGDLIPRNVLHLKGKPGHLGALGFQKLMFAPHEYDAAIALSEYLQVARAQGQRERSDLVSSFFRAYHDASGYTLDQPHCAGSAILRALQNAATFLQHCSEGPDRRIDIKFAYYFDAITAAARVADSFLT